MRVLKIIFLLLVCQSTSALNIDDAIKSTIENNSKVKIAVEKINESKELLNYSNGNKLPTVTGVITGSYTNADIETKTTSSTPETMTDSYKLTVTQNLFDAGFNNLEIERSEILFNNELINFQLTIQNLILEAITGYLTVINYEKSLEANKKNYDSVYKGFEETKTRFDLGSATLYDLQNSEASFAVAKTNLYAAEENVKISKKSFERIVGSKAMNLEDVIDINYLIDLNMILDNAKKNNLNLVKTSNEIKNIEILILKEKKSKLPNLDISASGLYSNGSRLENGTETTSGSVSLILTIPIFQKSQDDSNIRKYTSQLLQEEMSFQDANDDLEMLIENTYKDFKINKSKMSSNLIVIKSIETALSSLQAEYEIGTKTITDLIDQEEKLLNANVDYLNSKKDFLINYFNLKLLDGSLITLFKKYLPVFN
jgi:outer membrane protein